ncbi:DUF190 domain-containing protein [Methanocaldococcus sp.]
MKLLKIYIREGDKFEGELLYKKIIEILKNNNIKGATVFKGIYGYGERGVADFNILALSINLPISIEAVDEDEKIDSVVKKIKNIVRDNGLIITIDCKRW